MKRCVPGETKTKINGAPRASPCLHAEVPAFAETVRAGVPARRRGILRRRMKMPM